MEKNINKLKPFVKWVGGKTQLLEIIKILLPKNFNNYYEPFLGGAAVFLDLQPKNAIISDINSELITTWNYLKKEPKLLIEDIKKHMIKHNIEKKDYYLKIREQKNNLSTLQIASRFIYLNKTCFNGLYRVNKNNQFNVPYGNKDTLNINTIINKKNINAISTYLNKNNIRIKCDNYLNILKLAEKNDFIFVDPPYDSDTTTFDSYTPIAFGKQGQIELFNLLEELDKKGVKWMLTNHDTELINKLYKKYFCIKLPVNRSINSNGLNRKNATYETIFINYSISEHQKKELENILFFKTLKTSSYILKNYVSWSEINYNLDKNKILINDLNVLFSKTENEFNLNFNKLFDNIERKKCFYLLPLLLGKRVNNKTEFSYISSNEITTKYDFNDKEIVFNFIKESGLLKNLFLSKKYNNIQSFILGIEVGLSSNDKKNKSGLFMTNKIRELLLKNNLIFKEQVKYNDILKIELKNNKTFDFVFQINNITYCLECNFFNASGSKIYSEANRFIELNNTFSNFKDFKFIWVTDGVGLISSKKIIINAFEKINFIFNLYTFEKYLISLI